MANVQKIIKTAAYDSIKKMRSFRFISAVMMVVGLVLAVTSGMDQLIGDVNEKVSIWIVPHIFSNTFLLIRTILVSANSCSSVKRFFLHS